MSLGAVAPVSVRVNPDVDALTHAKISTGTYENKFGIPITRAREVYARAAALPGLAVHGIDMHIGSQITDLTPFADAAARLCGLARDLMADGHALKHIDFGGGLGIPYRDDNAPPPDPAALAATLRPHFAPLGLRPVFEIGRMIAGNAGILVTKVLYVKRGEGRTFVIVDGAMNDLIRPTLYDAFHALRPVTEPAAEAPRLVADVVGPVCESGDYFAKGREMPEPAPGDLIAVMSAGPTGRCRRAPTTPAPWCRRCWCAGPRRPWCARARRSRRSSPSTACPPGSADPAASGPRPACYRSPSSSSPATRRTGSAPRSAPCVT